MANYDGLSIPAFGAGNHYSEDSPTTANWSIADNGVFDMAVTTATADNVLSVTHTASAALTSGYDQTIYVALNITSTTTGNNATQRHAFATDITIAGAHTSWIGGGYIYISGSGTVSSAAIYGLNIHIAECTAADYLVNLWLQRDSTSTSGLDAYILFSGHPAGQSTDALFYCQGTKPTYFLQAAASGGFIDTTTTFGTAPAATGALACQIGSTTYYIKLQAS